MWRMVGFVQGIVAETKGFRSQVKCRVAFDAAMYLASVVDKATIFGRTGSQKIWSVCDKVMVVYEGFEVRCLSKFHVGIDCLQG